MTGGQLQGLGHLPLDQEPPGAESGPDPASSQGWYMAGARGKQRSNFMEVHQPTGVPLLCAYGLCTTMC